MPLYSNLFDCAEPKEAGPFKDFYDQYFYEIFAANPKVRIGIARLAFDAGLRVAQSAPGASDALSLKPKP
jgi:hypothetical protein